LFEEGGVIPGDTRPDRPAHNAGKIEPVQHQAVVRFRRAYAGSDTVRVYQRG